MKSAAQPPRTTGMSGVPNSPTSTGIAGGGGPAAHGRDKLAVRAEMWMREGEWQILVRAPEWVVDDFARHGSMSNGRRVWVHNFGGGVGGYSFLLGTVEVEPPSRRERFARWLLRVPRRRFATH